MTKLWEMTTEQLKARETELVALGESATADERRELNDCKIRLLDLKCPQCGRPMPYGMCAEPDCPQDKGYAWRGDEPCVLCGKPVQPCCFARVRLPSGVIALLEFGGMFPHPGSVVRRMCRECFHKHAESLLCEQLEDRENFLLPNDLEGDERKARRRHVTGVCCRREKNPDLVPGDPRTWLGLPAEPVAAESEEAKT